MSSGLKVTSGSGCGLIEKGDLGSNSLIHYEAKSTRKSSMRILGSWWTKACHQATMAGKRLTILQVAFMVRTSSCETFPELRWLVMRDDDYASIFPKRPVYGEVRYTDKSIPISQAHGLPAAAHSACLAGRNVVLFPEPWLTVSLVNKLVKDLWDKPV